MTPFRRQQLLLQLAPPLLLLLLLQLAAPAVTQAPPKIDRFENDELLRVKISLVQEVAINCPNQDGFLGISDRRNEKFVSQSRSLSLDLRFRDGDADAVRQMRDSKIGAYHCLYRQGNGSVSAFSFVVSEVPEQRTVVENKEFDTAAKRAQTFLCPITDASNIVWERYQDGTGLFIQQASGMRELALTYEKLSEDQSSGFTFWCCYSKADPKKIFYFEAKKSKEILNRTFQTSNYFSQLIPKVVQPTSRLTIECHGRFLATDDSPMTFYYRSSMKPNSTFVLVDCREDNPDYKCTRGDTQWQLEIKKFMPYLAGKYYCVKDGVRQRALVQADLGSVDFIKVPSTGYVLKPKKNEIKCQATQSLLADGMFLTLNRPGRGPLKLKPNSTVQGYTVTQGDDRLLVLSFDTKKEAEGATLDCQLHYVTKRITLTAPNLTKPELTTVAYTPTQTVVRCELKGVSYSDQQTDEPNNRIVRVNPDGSESSDLRLSVQTDGPRTYITGIDKTYKPYSQYKCYRTLQSYPVESVILTLGNPTATLDIYVEGDKNPSKKAFLAGSNINVECWFSDLPFQFAPAPDNVRLQVNGSQTVNLPPNPINLTVIRFVLPDVGPEVNGLYKCVYAKPRSRRAVQFINGSFQSPETQITICNSQNFLCDGECKDRSLLCNGTKECSDGSDERPENCNGCSPNAIPCAAYKGVEPRKKCVLKHWLCDGTNDCGNGFDEDVVQHKKWCFKESSCTGCQPYETCCPSNKTMCIRRSYECDKELDCPTGPVTDNTLCSEADCLEITQPQNVTVHEMRVGQSLNLTCRMTGSERPTPNWRLNWLSLPAGAIESSAVTERRQDGRYVVESTLMLRNITKEMAGIYHCEGVNNCKSLMRTASDLRVRD